MKNLIKNSFVIALAASGALFMNSCKKVDDTVKKPITAAEYYQALPSLQAKSVKNAIEIQSLLYSVLKVKGNTLRIAGDGMDFGNCATVTKDTTVNPHTGTIDFGSGCTNSNGKFFTGSIDLVWTADDIDVPGAYIYATFNNVNIDGEVFDGTYQMENLGLNGSGNPQGRLDYNLNSYNKLSEMELNGVNNLTLEMTDDPISGDKIATITGGGAGTTSFGFSYTQNIDQPLILTDCGANFVQGIVRIESPSLDTKFIDYGNGSCDDEALVVQGPSRTVITLD